MFVINIYLKFAIIAVLLIGGTVLAFTVGFWYAFPLLLVGLIFLASYIFLGTIQSAAQSMHSQAFAACEKRLNLTFKPNWLSVTNRSSYFLIKGSIDVQRGKHNEAEEWFNKGQALKLHTDNEKAVIGIQMINMHVSKKRWNQDNDEYRELKKLKRNGDMFKVQIKMLDVVL